MRVTALILFLGTALATATVASEPQQCDAVPLEVYTSEPELAERVCTVAAETENRLIDCGLDPLPPLRVALVDGIESAGGHCLAVTDCVAGTVVITHPDNLRNETDRPVYGGLIGRFAIFDSLIAHELAHTSLHETLGGREIGVAAHEYLAYALQIEALSDTDRAAFLDFQQTSAPASLEELNAIVLMFAPGVFAAKSWLHFSQPENGCAFVGKLIDGSVELGAPGI